MFFVDEVGQYVAPRQSLILSLDGFARALKEIGKGKVWFVATAQQTLQEITEKALLNSAELFKLKDRFPIPVELESTDIREITANRLLTKTTDGTAWLEAQWKAHGEQLRMHTHLNDWPGGRSTLDLRDDLKKEHPQAVEGVDRIVAHRSSPRLQGISPRPGRRSLFRTRRSTARSKRKMRATEAAPETGQASGTAQATEAAPETGQASEMARALATAARYPSLPSRERGSPPFRPPTSHCV